MSKIGYMCKTDFNDELGYTACEVYSSFEELSKKRGCIKECGWVQVVVQVVTEGNA